MACYNIDPLFCGGSCGGWGCYCEDTSLSFSLSFFNYKCTCQPKKALIVAFVFFAISVFSMLVLIAKWKDWEFPFDSEMHHPNKCSKFWATSISISLFICGLIAVGVGVNPMNKLNTLSSFPCSTTDGGLAAGFIFMVLGFWGIVSWCTCVQYRMCSYQHRRTIVVPNTQPAASPGTATIIVASSGPGYFPQQGYPPQGYPPQGYPQGYPPQGYPQGYPPQGYPQGYPPQAFGQPPGYSAEPGYPGSQPAQFPGYPTAGQMYVPPPQPQEKAVDA